MAFIGNNPLDDLSLANLQRPDFPRQGMIKFKAQETSTRLKHSVFPTKFMRLKN